MEFEVADSHGFSYMTEVVTRVVGLALWLFVALIIILTLFCVYLISMYQDSEAKNNNKGGQYIFVSRVSPRSSTPFNKHPHHLGLDHSRVGSSLHRASMGDGSPPVMRRLYSTDCPSFL